MKKILLNGIKNQQCRLRVIGQRQVVVLMDALLAAVKQEPATLTQVRKPAELAQEVSYFFSASHLRETYRPSIK